MQNSMEARRNMNCVLPWTAIIISMTTGGDVIRNAEKEEMYVKE